MPLRILNVGFFVGLLLFFQSCDLAPNKPVTDPEDTRPPTIQLLDPVKAEWPNFLVHLPLDSFPINIVFEDNYALKEYEIHIRHKPDFQYLRVNSDPWEKVFWGSLNGVEDTLSTHTWVNYDPYSGPYEFEVIARDQEGNEARELTYFNIQNLTDFITPTIFVASPSSSPVPTYKIGEYIHISASFSDNKGVIDGMFRIQNRFSKDPLEGGTAFYPNFIGGASIDTMIYIPPTLPGEYSVEFLARDSAYNLSLKTIPFIIETN